MKRILTIIILSVAAAVIAQLNISSPFFVAGVLKPAAGGGGWTEEITDTFSVNGTPPTGWTEINGSWAAALGVISPDDTTANRVIVSTTSTASSVQFVKVEYTTEKPASFDGVVLRHASGNVRYVIRYSRSASQLHLRYCSGANVYTTFHTIATVTLSSGDYLAVSVSGSDSSTEFKIWKNPTGGTLPSDWGAATYTINSGNWDGAPGTYHNSGTGVGLYCGAASSAYEKFDNFSAGSFQ